MSVYFIRAGNHIKIGRSADPWGRLGALQTANPLPLEMLAISPGGGELESGLHEEFGDFRINGEWFHVTERLLNYIESIRRTFPHAQDKPEVLTIQEEDGCVSEWIEFPKKGTVNPKRYAVRRAWMRDSGEWKKVTLGRVAEIPPLTEAQYRLYKETGELPNG